jgi:hypothetical protein
MQKVEKFEVKGAQLVLHLAPQGVGGAVGGAELLPAVPWLNVELVGCRAASYLPSTRGGLLLTDQDMTLPKLNKYVQVKDRIKNIGSEHRHEKII